MSLSAKEKSSTFAPKCQHFFEILSREYAVDTAATPFNGLEIIQKNYHNMERSIVVLGEGG